MCFIHRKRRWDDSEDINQSHEPVDSPGQPTETEANNSNEPTAPDVPKPTDTESTNGNQPSLENGERSFTSNVDINDSSNRQSLAKGATQRTVMEATGVEISTKGRYYSSPSDATPEDPALYLYVQAQSQESLDNAIAMIKRMKAEDSADISPGQTERKPDSFSASHAGTDNVRDNNSGYRPGSSGSQRLNGKLYIEVESERGFNVRAKLIGTGGENMKFIQNTTGARVQVRGRGSGQSEFTPGPDASEPMHLLITAQNEDSLRRACESGASLVDTVRAQYYEFKETGGRRHDHNRHGYPRNGQYNTSNGPGYRRNTHHSNQQYNRNDPYYNSQQGAYSQYQQQYQQQQQQQYAPHYPGADSDPTLAAQQPQPAVDGAEAEYDYAAYYAQYYQYYGTYPDYQSYYGQPSDPSAAQAPGAAAVPASEQQAYAEYYYQQQQQHDPMLVPGADLGDEPKEPADFEPSNGYHNVPPPSSYLNKDKKV
ncbi:hypothetical protein LPJ59_003061 [Coemansia sp. RSA 2399]|nr:hypothetical protein LPJ59_003061 [Coemansia sp. RSA 2399]